MFFFLKPVDVHSHHPDGSSARTTDTPGFKPFKMILVCETVIEGIREVWKILRDKI